MTCPLLGRDCYCRMSEGTHEQVKASPAILTGDHGLTFGYTSA